MTSCYQVISTAFELKKSKKGEELMKSGSYNIGKKKNIVVTIIIFMVISLLLSACENKSDSEEKTEKEELDTNKNISNTEEEVSVSELSIGDTFETDSFVFTLNNAQFTDYVDKVVDVEKILNEDFLLPTDHAENAICPEEGHILLAYDISLKYTGKTDFDGVLNDKMKLEYGDGYMFDVECMCIQLDGEWVGIDGLVAAFEPIHLNVLDDTAYTIRGYFEVPEEVKTNDSEPLKINVTGLGDKDVSYIIR